MKIFFRIAFRNIFRQRKRTIITFLSIAVGLGLMIVGFSLYNGIDSQALNTIIDTQTAHLKIFANGYSQKRDEFPLDITISDPQKTENVLNRTKNIVSFERRIVFLATLIKGTNEIPCTGIGIDTDAVPGAFDLRSFLPKDAALNTLNKNDQAMLIGSDLAADIGLKKGDVLPVRMISSTEDFSWNVLDLEVKGLLRTRNPQIDRTTLYVPISVVQESLGLGEAVTEIAVRLENRRQALKVKEDLIQELNDAGQIYEVQSYQDLASDFLKFREMRSRYRSVVPIIMLIIATLGITNTMLMAVFERTREIGILAAMGMRKKDLMILFILEGTYIGFFGSAAACILGGLSGLYLEVKGFNISIIGEGMSEFASSIYPIKDIFYGDVTLSSLIFVLIFGTVIAAMASVYPAYRAARLQPTEALRYM